MDADKTTGTVDHPLMREFMLPVMFPGATAPVMSSGASGNA